MQFNGSVGRLEIKADVRACIAGTVLFALLLNLGFWQLGRADEKTCCKYAGKRAARCQRSRPWHCCRRLMSLNMRIAEYAGRARWILRPICCWIIACTEDVWDIT